MNNTNIRELAAGLRTLIRSSEDSDHDAAIDAVCAAVTASAAEVNIEQDDDDSGHFATTDDAARLVKSTHTLTIGGEAVAVWVRCAVGDYGAGSHERHDCATWLVVEDDQSDERPDGALLTALDALGLADEIPDVEAPEAVDEDDSGEYGVLFRNLADDSRRETLWSLAGRYATEAEADAKCRENGRAFRARNSPGSYGPEWCVGGLDEGGRWQALDSDSDA